MTQYAPSVLAVRPDLRFALPRPHPPGAVLALGAYFKNAPCLLHSGEVVFGPNVGDLDDAAACNEVERVAERLLELADRNLVAVAHDLHPDFHSSRLAVTLAARLAVSAVAVQHHHAHVEAVLAENGYVSEQDGAVLGLALDGVGLGSDGTAWGGELLEVCGAAFERLGHLRQLPLPGGDRAAREPWRMAAAVLHVIGRGSEIASRFAHQPASGMLAEVLVRDHLCPPTSSLGRWFDAAAGLLGVCEVMRFEAEAAIEMERLASAYGDTKTHDGDWTLDAHGGLDLTPVCAALADEDNAARGAARFHAALVDGLAAWVIAAATSTGRRTVALSGGCFVNRILSSRLSERLSAHGLTVLQAKRLSPGDGGLALGQARVAAAQMMHSKEQGQCV